MKRFIHALVLSCVVIVSCQERPLDVIDKSFDIRCEAEFNKDALQSELTFILVKGSSDRTYDVSYTIDGKYAQVLQNSAGILQQSSFSLSFSKGPAVKYIVSDLASGPHTLSFDISSEGVSIHLDCPFEIPLEHFAFHAEANTSSAVSTAVLVSLTEGDPGKRYSVKVLDGEKVIASEGDVDFRKTPICSVALPLMRPGALAFTVLLSDGNTQESCEISFDEPLRYPSMPFTLGYNAVTNDITITVKDNPYGLWISSEVDAASHGSVTVNLQSGYFHGGPNTSTRTITKTATLSHDRFIPEGGQTVTLCCLNDLDRQVTESTAESYVWAYGYDPNMEEEGSWCMNFTQPVHYAVTGHSARVTITYESVDGVRMTLTGQNVSWLSPSCRPGQ